MSTKYEKENNPRFPLAFIPDYGEAKKKGCVFAPIL